MTETLQASYASLPSIACQGKCQKACGPIMLFPVEAEHLKAQGHAIPIVRDHPKWGAISCSALVKGHCSLYADRPLICRLWGLVRRMQCPFGCVPDRWVSDAEANALMAKLHKLDPGEPIATFNLPSPLEKTDDQLSPALSRWLDSNQEP